MLSIDQINERLAKAQSWEYDGQNLVRTFKHPSFPAAIAFVNRVAQAAERLDHHPDIDIRYDKVRLAVHTHSEGGVTERDFELANAVNGLLE